MVIPVGHFTVLGKQSYCQIWEKFLFPGEFHILSFFSDVFAYPLLSFLSNLYRDKSCKLYINSLCSSVNLILLWSLCMWERFLKLPIKRNSGCLWQIAPFVSRSLKNYPILYLPSDSAHHSLMMIHLPQSTLILQDPQWVISHSTPIYLLISGCIIRDHFGCFSK